MSVFGGPNIIEDGLVLCLDAGNTKSYPGTGTTWTDLTRNGNNGTLNGPTFSNTNGGGIVFDAVNDYVAIPNSSSLNPTVAVSLCAFINFTSIASNYAPIIFKQNNYNGSYEQYSLYMAPGGPLGLTITGPDRSQKSANSGGDYRNIFIYVVGVISTVTDDLKLYINGNLIASNTTFTSTFDVSTNQVHIGGMPTVFTGYSGGRIFNASIYNRALSQSEILQNFNAVKGRYGL